MKAALCIVVLMCGAVLAAEEKKNEKRGVLGLGYGGVAAAPLVGHGYYGHGLGLYNQGLYGHGLYGHGIAAAPLLGHGYYGHGYSAPLVSHSLGYSAPLSHSLGYSAPLHTPLLGLGHGWH